MKSSEYRQGLESLDRSGEPALVSGSFELRPGASGFETATTICCLVRSDATDQSADGASGILRW